MTSHQERLGPYVRTNPNAAGFLTEVDAIKAQGFTGEQLENKIVDLAVKIITMVEGRATHD